MSAPVAEDRDGTVKDADGALYAIIYTVLVKHKRMDDEWERHIERRAIRR